MVTIVCQLAFYELCNTTDERQKLANK